MKRIIAMLLSIMMVVTMMPTVAFATDTGIKLTVDTSACATAKAGETVNVPVYITENPGVNMIIANVVYASNIFDLVSIEGSTEFVGDGSYDITGTKFSWETDGDDSQLSDVLLFTVTLTVKEGATAGNTIVTVDEDSIDCSDGEWNSFGGTVVSGTIEIVFDTAASFVNGDQTMTYDEAKADAEGGNTLAAPVDGYYFAGWFSGLSDDYKDSGYYVIAPTETVSEISGTELRPMYDTPPTEGTYNALWIKGDGSYVVNVNDSASTLEVVVGTDDDTALSTAITTANGAARTKLVKDMSLSTMLQLEVAMNLDMNGHSITRSSGYVLGVKVDGSTVESSRAGGGFVGSQSLFNYTANSLLGQFELIRDVNFAASADNIAIKIKNGSTIQNCTFTGYVYLTEAGETVIDNCQITTSTMLLKVETGTAKVSNTDMTTTWSSTYAPLQLSSGVIELGAGNTVTATSLTYLFSGTGTATFTAVDGTYQLKAGAALARVLNDTAPTVTCSTGEAASIDSTGKVVFGTGCTVTYMADGSVSTTKTGVVGQNADLTVTHTYGDGYNYTLVGWTNVENGTEPLTELELTGDTTLYAIKARRGIIISSASTKEYESGDVTLTAQYNNASKTTTIYNADRLNELDSLTLNAASSKYSYITFNAEALDAIAAQINGDSKNMTVIMYHATSLSDGVASQIQIKFLYGSTEITLPEGVELHLYANTNKSNAGTHQKFAAYNAADSDTLLEATTYLDSSNSYFVSFPLTANGTYEMKALGAYLTESQMTGDVSVTLASDTELIVENAAKLADMSSLYITNGSAYMTFSAAALDSIAANAGNGSVTLSLEREVFTSPEDGVAARLELSVADASSNAVDFEGAVEIWTTFPFTEGKSYRAYYVPETGDAVGLATVIGDRSSTYKTATFTTTHFSTFEVQETEVAAGYTAGLNTTTTEVRAGGETVPVYVQVSHSDADQTVFNAAEIVVEYAQDLLTPNTDNLPEGTFKIDEENGILTIEDYGADKNFGTSVYTLNFVTIDTVDAAATATVTLKSAAFVHKENAATSDLIVATTDPAVVAISIGVEAFDVTYADTNVTGPTKATKNENFTFSVLEFANYDYTEINVKVGETTYTLEDLIDNGSGSYTLPGEYVTGPLSITYTRTPKIYTVTFDNVSVSGADATATYGVDYTFTMPSASGYQYTLAKITIGGAEYTGYSKEDGVVTIPGADITGNIVITISSIKTVFSVTIEGNGAGDAEATDSGNDGSFDRGESVTLTITPVDGYTYTVTATMGGSAVTPSQSGNTYTITNVTGDIVFTVTKELNGTVTVSQYLTLNAETATNGGSLFLVVYEASLAEGSVATYGEDKETMFWSAKYGTKDETTGEMSGAWCFLVQADTLDEETAKASIGAKTADKVAIAYDMDVNETSVVDAADAQFVYNMYKTMYSGIDASITMAKYLEADVNGDKAVNVDDASAIIADILNG